MKVALLLLSAVASVSAIFEIDELRKMVPTYTDKAQLKVLDDDRYTPRSQIQQKVNQIVQNQTQDIQTAYNTILQAEQSKDQYERQRRLDAMRNRGASEQAISTQQQIYTIEDNYALSKQEARDQTRNLIMGLSWSDRRLIDD